MIVQDHPKKPASDKFGENDCTKAYIWTAVGL